MTGVRKRPRRAFSSLDSQKDLRGLFLSVCDLGWRAGGVQVLERVTFDVQPGEFVALMGRNGAGKSTLIDIVAGLRTPAEGTVRLAQRALDDWTPVSPCLAIVERVGKEVDVTKRVADAERETGILVAAGIADERPAWPVRLAVEVRQIARALIPFFAAPAADAFAESARRPAPADDSRPAPATAVAETEA